ncbi:MAG: hypothetical protein ACFE0O_14445 [Opitutales bacterium]
MIQNVITFSLFVISLIYLDGRPILPVAQDLVVKQECAESLNQEEQVIYAALSFVRDNWLPLEEWVYFDQANNYLSLSGSRKYSLFYIMALGHFLYHWSDPSGGNLLKAKEFADKALNEQYREAEALWLRSQIYAIQGDFKNSKIDQCSFLEVEDSLNPIYYLFDKDLISQILDGARKVCLSHD